MGEKGLNRDWSWEELDEWHKVHTFGRVVVPRAKKPEPEPAPPPAGAPDPPKPTAESVILQAAGFTETRTIKLRKEIERLELIIERERARLIDRELVRQSAIKAAAIWCGELDAMVQDMAGQVAGLSEAEVLPKMRNRAELLKVTCRAAFAEL